MESNICWSVQRRKLASSLKELLQLCETLGLGLWSYDFVWHIHSSRFLDVGQGDEIDYRGVLHRDGSVLMSVSLDQLKVMTYKIVQLLTYAHKSVTLLTTQIKLLCTQAHMSYSLHFGQSRVVVECLQGCGWVLSDWWQWMCLYSWEHPVVFSSCAINCFLTCQQAPETLYRALATKLIIGMPYKVLPFLLYVLPIALISSQLNLLSFSCSPR